MNQDEKKIITVNEIADLIDEGHTRKEIAQKLEISDYDLQQFCKHPKLKGRKPGKKSNVMLKDDDGNTYTTAQIRNIYGDKDRADQQQQHQQQKNTEEGDDPSQGAYQEPVSTDLEMDQDQEQDREQGTFGEDDQ